MLASLGFASIVCGFRVAVALVAVYPDSARSASIMPNPRLSLESVRLDFVRVISEGRFLVFLETAGIVQRMAMGVVSGISYRRLAVERNQEQWALNRLDSRIGFFLSSSCSLASDTALRLAGRCDSHSSLRRLACPVGDLRFNLPQQRH